MQPDVTAVASILERSGIRGATVESVAILGTVARVSASDMRDALQTLKACDARYAFMVDLFGVDTGETLDVVCHLRSFSRDEDLIVKAHHEYDAVYASIWDIFPAALMPEREMCELFGMKLAGHPNPKRLLTTDGVPPYLRKEVAIRNAEEVRDR